MAVSLNVGQYNVNMSNFEAGKLYAQSQGKTGISGFFSALGTSMKISRSNDYVSEIRKGIVSSLAKSKTDFSGVNITHRTAAQIDAKTFAGGRISESEQRSQLISGFQKACVIEERVSDKIERIKSNVRETSNSLNFTKEQLGIAGDGVITKIRDLNKKIGESSRLLDKIFNDFKQAEGYISSDLQKSLDAIQNDFVSASQKGLVCSAFIFANNKLKQNNDENESVRLRTMKDLASKAFDAIGTKDFDKKVKELNDSIKAYGDSKDPSSIQDQLRKLDQLFDSQLKESEDLLKKVSNQKI